MAPSRPRPPRQPRVRPPRDPRDALKRRALDLIGKIENKDRYAIFLQPVDVNDIPGYAEVISRPMDLSTVRTNISVGVYRTPDDLRADLDLIWANCIKFNADDSIYYKEAVRLRALAGKYFEEFLRNLSRDGLPYGPRKSGAAVQSTTPSNGAPVASSHLVKPARAVSLRTTAQRLRVLARARRKSAERAGVAVTSGSSRGNVEDDPLADFSGDAKTGQIFAGPYQRLRRFPKTPAAAAFPYVRGTKLQQRLEPFPRAWQALGSWNGLHQQKSNFMSEERDVEMHYARRYQDYVTQSAPIARRLLASILDPFAVLEHDARSANQTIPTSNLTGRLPNGTPSAFPRTAGNGSEAIAKDPSHKRALATGLPVSPMKRPRHGDVHGSGSSACPEVPSSPLTRNPAVPKPQAPMPPSPGAIQDLRDMLRAHKIDDSFLTSILEGSSSAKTRKNEVAASLADVHPHKPPVCDSTAVDTEMSDPADPGDSAILANGDIHGSSEPVSDKDIASGEDESDSSSECENASEGNSSSGEGSESLSEDSSSESSDEDSSEDVGEDDGSCEADAERTELLSMNHAALLNLQRIRALKETATGIARKDLTIREEELACALRNGVALAMEMLPPRLLVPQEKAAELALKAAKESLRRRDVKSKLLERTKEKARVVASSPSPTATASMKKAVGNTSTPTSSVSHDLAGQSKKDLLVKTVAVTSERSSVPAAPPAKGPPSSGEMKSKQDFAVKKLTPPGAVNSAPKVGSSVLAKKVSE